MLGALGLDSTLQAIRDRLPAAGAASEAKAEQIRAILAGTVTANVPAPVTSSASLAAVNAAVTVPVPAGATLAMFDMGATAFSATVQFEVSVDGGTTWRPLAAIPAAAASLTTSTSTQGTFLAGLFPGATHVRSRCSAWTSGTVAAVVAVGYAPSSPVIGINGNIAVVGTGRMGFTAAHGVWINDTTTVLAASATYTGASRDMVAVTTGTAFNSASTFAREFRVVSASDQTGTLKVQVSADGTTWRTLRAQATQSVDGTNVAEIVAPVYTRYYRAVYVNGVTPQTSFLLNSVMVAA